MIVSYLKTLYRNEFDGYTEFSVIPRENCTRNVLKCKGYIPVYKEGTPLVIYGEENEGYIEVKNVTLNETSDLFNSLLIDFLISDLSDTQTKKILELSYGNMFSYLEEGGREKLNDIFKKTKNAERKTNVIIHGLKMLKTTHEFAELFIKYKIPLDAMSKAIKDDVSIDRFKRGIYDYAIKYKIPINIADNFALKECKIDEFSIKRYNSFIKYAVYEDLKTGNSCQKVENIINRVNYYFSICEKPTEIGYSMALLCLSKMKNVLALKKHCNDLYIYLNTVLKEEENIKYGISRINENKINFNPEINIPKIEKKLGIEYNEGQKNCFNIIKTSGVKILTGPPGSGKTAVIRGLIEAATTQNVALSATTGMAAKVMSDACKAPAVTLHKLLDYVPFENDCKCKNINNPIPSEFIIVDESSMMGVKLCSLLFNAVKSNSTILIVGDEDQLASVDYGNVLHDLINSKLIEVYRLTEIMRQSGLICENARKINKGDPNIRTDANFNIIKCSNADEIKEMLLNNYDQEKAQILSPTKKGNLGTYAIHSFFVDQEKEILVSYGYRDFRLGEKVVMTANNYDLDYINGDVGYITDYKDGNLIIQLKNKILQVPYDCLSDVDFADALTIHKAQGSEYEDVHIILPDYTANMMSRKLLYTAITRAKKRVYIYVTDDITTHAIKNNNKSKRISLLYAEKGW